MVALVKATIGLVCLPDNIFHRMFICDAFSVVSHHPSMSFLRSKSSTPPHPTRRCERNEVRRNTKCTRKQYNLNLFHLRKCATESNSEIIAALELKFAHDWLNIVMAKDSPSSSPTTIRTHFHVIAANETEEGGWVP